MANHGAAAIILIASLIVAVALSGVDGRLTTVHHNDANRGYMLVKAAAPVPKLSCSKVHGVQADETCSSVAAGSGLKDDDFLAFNPNINCDQMFVGQWVCLKATSA